nr:cytochrome B5 [Hymenolepis microstoma]
MPEQSVFTLEEIQKHKSENDCWIVIHDKVYNVSEFLNEHPGGDFVILENGGGYATEPFEDVCHSVDARKQMEKYCIGVIAEADKERKLKFSSNYSQERTANFSGWTGAILPAIIGIAAVVAYFYIK